MASGSNGGFVRLKDIARLELGSENYTYDSLMNGHPAVGFGVKLTSDANALNTINQVKAVLQKASANFSDGMSYKIVTDNTSFVKASMKEVLKTFAEALLSGHYGGIFVSAELEGYADSYVGSARFAVGNICGFRGARVYD